MTIYCLVSLFIALSNYKPFIKQIITESIHGCCIKFMLVKFCMFALCITRNHKKGLKMSNRVMRIRESKKTDNPMAKRKTTKVQTMIYKILHRPYEEEVWVSC